MTINSTNFNTYATQNTFTKQTTQNSTPNKEANLNQTWTNPTQNSQSTNLANFVLDKSEAVSKAWGYGVDKQGYFTSDFNEAAGLPKDYKINSKMLTNTLNLYTKTGFYKEIDVAKSFANAYENFTKNDVSQVGKGEALTRHFLAYRKDFLEGQSSFMGKVFGFDKNVSSDELQEFQNFMNKNRITNDFLNPLNLLNPSVDLKTNLNSKELLSLGGVRFSVSEYDDLMREDWNFAFDETSFDIALKSTEEFYPEFSPLISEISKDYKELLHSSVSLDEFKEEYIKLKIRFDDFIAKVKGLHQEKLENGAFENKSSSTLSISVSTKQSVEEKAFTPIEAQSSSETYSNTSGSKNLELAKTEQMKAMLELLFKQKAGESSSLSNLNFLNLNSTFSNSVLKDLRNFINSGDAELDLKA